MSRDEFVYIGLLLLSVIIGPFVKRINAYRSRQFTCSAIGFAVVLLVCGEHVLHSLLSSFVNCLIIKSIRPRFCHAVSFLWGFGYIAFFRMSHLFGLPSPPPHANAVQLILTLKMIGIAFEMNHSRQKPATVQSSGDSADEDHSKLKSHYQHIEPTLADMMLYNYCYIGVLTGPYYKYRTYVDMLHQSADKDLGVGGTLLHRLRFFPLYAIGFLVASSYFSINYVRTDAFYTEPFWYRVFYMTPVFYIFRMRFYVAWILAECMCITVGLGAYPKSSKPRCGGGPTDFKALHDTEKSGAVCEYDFETIKCIDVYGCEFAPTVRDGLRSWNTTVQYWLSSNVYKRLPIKSAPAKVAITMMTSAFWHGFHAGYYLSLMFVPVCLVVEVLATRVLLGHKPTARRSTAFSALNWFCKMRAFDYMCMGFLLLSWHETLRYWSSIYYYCHLAAALMFVTLTLLGRRVTAHKKWS